MEPNFSVVLIARNESKTLPRLIGSLKEFQARGGEIVLVDTGSTDGTAEIARSLGCTVFEEGARFVHTISAELAEQINSQYVVAPEAPLVAAGDTLFDFSAARNYAASLAKNDMVAMPDCDEIYTSLDLDAVCHNIAAGVEQLEYNFVFAHDDRGGELVKFMHSKFYDRRALKWVGIIHEILQGEAKRQFVEESIIKLEHWQNPETNRGGYLKGLALAVIQDPENDRNAHYLGRELLYTGRPRSAIKQLERHVAMKKWPEERSQSLIHIGEAYDQIGKRADALHAWMDALDTCPSRRESLMKIAELYFRENNAEMVIIYASAALQIPQNNFYATFQPYYQNLPHELLYWALWYKGNKQLSKVHYEVASACQPFNSKYLHDARYYEELPKISIIIPTRRPKGLDRCIESIRALNYPQDKIQTIVLHDGMPDTGIRHDGCEEYFSAERNGVPITLALGVKAATADWIVYAADDMEFEPDCIAAAVREATLPGPDHLRGFIAFNSGPLTPDEGNICEHFMIHRVMLEYLPKGEIFDTDFHHVGVDNLLWSRMKKAGEAFRSEHARIVHRHFSRGGEWDEVARTAWNPEDVAADRALLEEKLGQL